MLVTWHNFRVRVSVCLFSMWVCGYKHSRPYAVPLPGLRPLAKNGPPVVVGALSTTRVLRVGRGGRVCSQVIGSVVVSLAEFYNDTSLGLVTPPSQIFSCVNEKKKSTCKTDTSSVYLPISWSGSSVTQTNFLHGSEEDTQLLWLLWLLWLQAKRRRHLLEITSMFPVCRQASQNFETSFKCNNSP